MDYKLTYAVWELTMKCNMRCQHCGSSCENAMEDELTTKEALALCDDLKELGLSCITLSGGELTTRSDWHLIAKRCVQNDIITNMITNGWNLNDELLKKAEEAGVNTIAISMDGCRDTHDKIRRQGSFERNIMNLEKIKEHHIVPAVITTVQKQNIKELEALYECLQSVGVKTWQIQIALPMGNFKQHMWDCLKPEDVQTIIDFAYSKIEDEMIIDLADCIGYYSKKDIALKKKRFGNHGLWHGCSAGKYSLGILNNGDIVGCTSIRSKDFIEGNIRKRKLRDIWQDQHSFSWNRSFQKEDLKGNCRECQYGDYCLGGCSNLRYCMYGDIHSENTYCVYHIQISEYQKKINKMISFGELTELLKYMIDKKQYQVATMLLKRIKELHYDTEDLQEIEAYLSFFQKNYISCKKINQAILVKQPENKRAKKGYGLALYRLGQIEEGISAMYEALDENDPESYLDLYIVLKEQNRIDDANKVMQLQRGVRK